MALSGGQRARIAMARAAYHLGAELMLSLRSEVQSQEQNFLRNLKKLL